MLLFKPAPMYILDEVDAALDLSHTQNIGVMLRAHFKASQFIVVSLKEGMFNNANVVFRTKFVDGVDDGRADDDEAQHVGEAREEVGAPFLLSRGVAKSVPTIFLLCLRQYSWRLVASMASGDCIQSRGDFMQILGGTTPSGRGRRNKQFAGP